MNNIILQLKDIDSLESDKKAKLAEDIALNMLYKYYEEESALYGWFSGNKPIKLCSPAFHVIAIAKNANRVAKIIEIKDKNGNIRRSVIPTDIIRCDPKEFVRWLENQGVSVMAGPNVENHVINYTKEDAEHKEYVLADKTGWLENSFVLPSKKVIGNDPIVSIGDGSDLEASCGTLEEWSENVGKYCVGNTHLVFALGIAVAPIFFPFIDINESFGFHFVGPSSSGKTTILHVASSVWGKPKDVIRQWRTTDNALEAIAEKSNHCLLPIDEIGQADSRDLEKISYMVANEMGKSRMTSAINLRRTLSWQTIIVSSGEVTLAETLETNGKRPKVGAELRILNIPINSDDASKVFDCLHGFKGGDKISNHMKEVSKKYNGSPIEALLEKTTKEKVENKDSLTGFFRDRISDLVTEMINKEDSSQVKRVARHFAFIGVSTEKAIRSGVYSFLNVGSGIKAAKAEFELWKKHWGNCGVDRELESDIEIILRAIRENYTVRFIFSEENSTDKVRDAFGYRESDHNREYIFFVWPKALKQIIGKSPSRQLKEELIKRGYLASEPKTEYIKVTKQSPYMYRFTSKVLGDFDEISQKSS
jgi:putative DNA primase/helicase